MMQGYVAGVGIARDVKIRLKQEELSHYFINLISIMSTESPQYSAEFSMRYLNNIAVMFLHYDIDISPIEKIYDEVTRNGRALRLVLETSAVAHGEPYITKARNISDKYLAEFCMYRDQYIDWMNGDDSIK